MRDSRGRFTSWEEVEQGRASAYVQKRKGARWKRLSGAAERSAVAAALREGAPLPIPEAPPEARPVDTGPLPSAYLKESRFGRRMLKAVNRMDRRKRERVFAVVEFKSFQDYGSASRLFREGVRHVPIDMGILTRKQAEALTDADIMRAVRDESRKLGIIRSDVKRITGVGALVAKEKRVAEMRRLGKLPKKSRKSRWRRGHGRRKSR